MTIRTFAPHALAAALVAALLLWAPAGHAQAVLQAGPILNGGGHAPMYVPSGPQGLATVMDSGPAAGGANGMGLSEILQQSRPPQGGTGPSGPGTGPLGTHNCFWDTFATNPIGANWLCWDANVNGSALITSKLPLQFNVAGQIVPFPPPASATASIMYVNTSGGSDSGNTCAAQSTPCLTISHALIVAADARFADSGLNDLQINVSPGSYAGFSAAGHFQNASGQNREPCITIAGSGDASAGANATHLTNDLTGGTQVWDAEVSGNACVVLRNIDLVETANNYGFFTQDGGSHVFLAGNVSCTGPSSGTEAQTCGHAEGGAYIEAVGPSPRITIQGLFAWGFTIGATPAKLTFDPGANGVISCGTGLTLDSAGGSFLVDASVVTLSSGWSWDPSCNGIVGHPVVEQHNAVFNNLSGNPLPNVGSFRKLDNSVYTPVPLPGLTTCPNASIVNSAPVNSNNNTFQVLFSGADSQCTIEFGSFLTNQFWFTNTPLCTVSGSNQLKTLGISYPLNGVTVTPQSAFGDTDTITVNCPNPAQG